MADSHGHGWRRHHGLQGTVVAGLAGLALVVGGLQVPTTAATTATAGTTDLRVLLVGDPADPTTGAWASTLSSEGVAFTEVDATGGYGAEQVALPSLTSGTTGRFDGVVLAGAPAAFAAGQLDGLFAYEAAYGVRQVDGYAYPSPALGLMDATSGDLGGTTGQLTDAALAALPALKGPVPMATGTYGYGATVVAGAPVTPWMTDAAGNVLAAVYQHAATDAQAGVPELMLGFDYSGAMLQWELLGPGIVTWVTGGTHLGLYRNYFGEGIDDVFLADDAWDSALQCTPAATDPVDAACPPADQGNAAVVPDLQMSAADVTHVVDWQQQAGITLDLAFNGYGACTAPAADEQSSANCTGSARIGGTTYTDPGQQVDAADPTTLDDHAMVDTLLANQAAFDWTNHTWSHLALGCAVPAPQPLTWAAAGSGGSLPVGGYRYEVTAVTAYGESEPSAPRWVFVWGNGSVTLTWPDAPNAGGPNLAQLAASYGGGSGFWGYHVYRQDPGSSTFRLVGSVPEGAGQRSYRLTDTGSTAPGAAPTTDATSSTATNPAIDCQRWLPATAWNADPSIGREIGLNDAFAAANGLTHYTPSTLVTGEYSGLENPNMPTALAALGVTTVGTDASRQPAQYALGGATTSPRYPSNIFYNASNWIDEVNEYNTIYVEAGLTWQSTDSAGHPLTLTGRCVGTSTTTCRTTPATEQDVLASESSIMLSHVLGNDPRVGFAHQSNLMGPATTIVDGQTVDYGYTILTLIDAMRARYAQWTTAPLAPASLAGAGQVLREQGDWAKVQSSAPTQVNAVRTGSTVVLTNTGSTTVTVPVTVPEGSISGGLPFGQAYGGSRSAWVTLGPGTAVTVDTAPGPTPSPALTAITPDSGPQAGGTTVTLSGVALQGATVSFGPAGAGTGVAVRPDGTSLTVAAPPSASAQTVPVTVTTAGGTSNALSYTYVAVPPPVVTGLFPTQGSTGSYTLVWVFGRNLSPTSGVSVGGQAAPFAGISGTLAVALAPPTKTAGTVDVRVTTPKGGTSAVTPADRFTYTTTSCLLCWW